MAKKETLNPITAFRKANEARKAVVVKSLKKAQEGIVQDTSSNNVDLYNKEMLAKQQYENMKESQRQRNRSNQEKNKEEMNQAKANKDKTDALNAIYYNYKIGQRKKGGSVKKK
jgi:hypothetical protein